MKKKRSNELTKTIKRLDHYFLNIACMNSFTIKMINKRIHSIYVTA